MAEQRSEPDSGRRRLLRATLWGGGLAGLGALGGIGVKRLTQDPPAPKRPPLGPEFTYDVSRFQTSDPGLIQWRELSRFPSGLERPRNLCTTPGGHILVCGDDGIRRFDADGRELGFSPIQGRVHAVAVLPDESLLAGLPDQVQVIAPDGKVRAVWELEDVLPTSIAVADSRIFLADAHARVIRVLDLEGRPLQTIGQRDPDKGIEGFVVPSPYFCVRAAPDGLLRIANPGKHTIEAWTTDGDLELAWGRASFAIDGFCGCCNPVSFALLPDGGYVTGEKGLPRVKTYDECGAFTGIVAGTESFPEYVQATQAGTPEAASAGIYVVVDAAGRVLILDAIGGTVRIMVRKEDGDG
ncbi:hypothetical protein [Haloferula sp. A504]|uniref:hypothetical protein n=1 Tax=Haloferula sp. A504 TaxID=3373601 RepID=UPI0031C6BD8C|nr:hypothetical protein [Verrucomicrobiaceae bacterium E54]